MKKQQYGHVERSSDVVYQDEVETCAEQSSTSPSTLAYASLRLNETFSVRTNYSGVVTL